MVREVLLVNAGFHSQAGLRTLVGWALALAATVYLYSGAYRFTFQAPYRLGDFFQEWASAKNYFEGLPIYTPQEVTAWHYLQQTPDASKQIFVRMNGHPPPCVLVSLPFAQLDYAVALYLWNGLSIAALLFAAVLVLRFELGTWRTWLWLPLLTMLASNPLVQHVILGQLGIFLLLLIVGTMIADDRGRPVTAGLLLGTATALKLFPGLLFLYFLIHRKWRTLLAGAGCVLAWNVACLALFGVQTYDHFIRYAMPEVLLYRDWWANYSITGTWFKLFQPWSRQSVALWHDPMTAQWGAWVTMAMIIGATAFIIHRGRGNVEAQRSSFAVLIATMVLVAPIAWDHYFLLLLWPLVRLAIRMPRSWTVRLPYYLALGVAWLNPLVLYVFATGRLRPATGGEILFIVSWPFYAFLAIYGLSFLQALCESAASSSRHQAAVAAPTLQAVSSS